MPADRHEEERNGDPLEEAGGHAPSQPTGESSSTVCRHDHEVDLGRERSEFCDHIALPDDHRDREASWCSGSQALEILLGVLALEFEERSSSRWEKNGRSTLAEAEMLERRHNASQGHRCGQAFGQLPGERKDMLARWRTVERDEEMLGALGEERDGTLRRTQDESGTLGLLEDLLGDSPEEQAAQAAASMRRERDEVSVQGSGLTSDRSGDSGVVGRDHRDAAGNTLVGQFPADPVQISGGGFGRREVRLTVDPFGWGRFEDVKENQFAAARTDESSCDGEDLLGER